MLLIGHWHRDLIWAAGQTLRARNVARALREATSQLANSPEELRCRWHIGNRVRSGPRCSPEVRHGEGAWSILNAEGGSGQLKVVSEMRNVGIAPIW